MHSATTDARVKPTPDRSRVIAFALGEAERRCFHGEKAVITIVETFSRPYKHNESYQ